jgi:hypothetical protein
MTVKVKAGYKVVSSNGNRNLGGPYKTLQEAKISVPSTVPSLATTSVLLKCNSILCKVLI